jgi:hypothetical protein
LEVTTMTMNEADVAQRLANFAVKVEHDSLLTRPEALSNALQEAPMALDAKLDQLEIEFVAILDRLRDLVDLHAPAALARRERDLREQLAAVEAARAEHARRQGRPRRDHESVAARNAERAKARDAFEEQSRDLDGREREATEAAKAARR